MLRFSELLQAQVQNEIPYSALKNLLRALNSNCPLYPQSGSGALSESQTPGQSQLSLPLSTPPHVSLKPFSQDNGLQPKQLFPNDGTQTASPPGSFEFHPRQSDTNSSPQAVPSAEHELQRLLEQVEDTKLLTSRHAQLLGSVINTTVLHLAEELRMRGVTGEISLTDIAKFFNGKSDQVYDFLEASYLRNFKQDDVVASVFDDDKGIRSVAVYYSVQFWASLWNDYVAGTISLTRHHFDSATGM